MEISDLFINASDLKILSDEFSKGPHGNVYIVETFKDEVKYAAKIINIEDNFDGNEQALLIKESLVMHKLNHPAIAKFIGINFMSIIDSKLHEPTIITDYFPKGSLKDIFDYKENNILKQYWTFTKKYINLLGICDALRYLHDQRIIHSNLKPENILFDIDYNPHLSDYYFSRCFPKMDKNSFIEGQYDTSIYIAPEILQGNDGYGESADVYAFSMIAYQIITEKVPYNEIYDSSSSLKNKIINGERPKFPESVQQDMKNLLSKCWSEKPEDRPRFKEIYSTLSGDLIYSFEEIDKNEIQKYIDMIEDSKKEQNDINEKSSIEEQIKDLKSTMFLCFFKNKIAKEKDALINYFSEQAAISATNKDVLNELGDDIINSSFTSYFIKDYSTALYSYEKAVQLGSKKAYEGLGNIYFYGYGVQKDYSKALRYYEKAYRNGNLHVSKKLGDIYKHGYGVDKNAKKANEYYKIRINDKIKIGIHDIFIYSVIFALIFIIIIDRFKVSWN